MDMPIDFQHQAMGYDRTATMFSPEGHLLQVEYAEKTVRLGSSSIGMACTDGVFILADKRITDKLMVQESASRIHEIDAHLVASIAGITSDGRVLVERAQVLSQAVDGDTTWGVKLQTSGISLFKGASYAGRDINFDEDYSLNGNVTPTGVTEVVFSKLLGIPNTTGTLTLTNTNSEVQNITIGSKGQLDY